MAQGQVTVERARASQALAAHAGIAPAAAVFAVHAIVAFFIRNSGWDDGAITLAFARTFASEGRIALTPSSEEVEGFSSVAWFLLMSGAAKLGLSDFDTLIRTSQVVAALCSAWAAGLLHSLLRAYMQPAAAAILAVCVFCSGPFLNESMNGMEMSLLALVALLIAWTLGRPAPRQNAALLTLGLLASTVRVEATIYVVGAAAAVWFLGRRRLAGQLAAGAIIGTALQAVLRLSYFGSLLPNTLIAKRHAPYSADGLGAAVSLRFDAAMEPFFPFLLALLALGVLLVASRRQIDVRRFSARRLSMVVAFAVGYVLFVWAFNAAIGRNWGYAGRMQLSAFPLAVVAVAAVLRQVGARWRLSWAAVVASAALIGSMYFLQHQHVREAWDGDTALTVTPAEYRTTGEAADQLRRHLGTDTISFLTPDIGGAGLCCPRLEILDLGLLTNSRLARTGYEGLDAYLADVRPDVIETHGLWSQHSGIYASRTFLEEYTPAVVDGTWLWVRHDLVGRLPAGGTPPADLTQLRYRGDPVDEDFLRTTDRRPVVVD